MANADGDQQTPERHCREAQSQEQARKANKMPASKPTMVMAPKPTKTPGQASEKRFLPTYIDRPISKNLPAPKPLQPPKPSSRKPTQTPELTQAPEKRLQPHPPDHPPPKHRRVPHPPDHPPPKHLRVPIGAPHIFLATRQVDPLSL